MRLTKEDESLSLRHPIDLIDVTMRVAEVL
jgi:hypothetical protein